MTTPRPRRPFCHLERSEQRRTESYQWSEAKRAGESASCVQKKDLGQLRASARSRYRFLGGRSARLDRQGRLRYKPAATGEEDE
jgi:hypothetical protein